MTEQEAMEIIMQVAYDGEFPLNSNEAFGIACKCMVKQIPQKVVDKDNCCTICEEMIPRWDSKYCPGCGQAIKWD